VDRGTAEALVRIVAAGGGVVTCVVADSTYTHPDVFKEPRIAGFAIQGLFPMTLDYGHSDAAVDGSVVQRWVCHALNEFELEP
jgi:hypothetical protein